MVQVGARAGGTDSHWLDSSLREKVLEHLFVGELLRFLWCRGRRDIEVLRAEVDRGGYDLAVECNGVLRHIQLKASHRDATASKVSVNIALAAKPNGCIRSASSDRRRARASAARGHA